MIPFKSPIIVGHVGNMEIGEDLFEGNRLLCLGESGSAGLDEEIGESLREDVVDGWDDTG